MESGVEARADEAKASQSHADALERLEIQVACPLCGADDYRAIYAAGVAQVNQVVECRRCGLMYANPRQPADEVRMETWTEDPDWDYAAANPQKLEKERLQVRDYARTRRLLNELHPGRGRLVEIGSSLGFLLGSFRAQGWQVLGIEPNPHAARFAIRRAGIETVRATLESAKLPDGFADVVVMLHVIEHLPDPLSSLREIHRILKPGGHLILETPRYDTLMFKLLGARERSVRCDGHITFFTTHTLTRACRAAGFELVRRDYCGRSITLDRFLYNVGVISKSRSVARALAVLGRRAKLNRVAFTLNLRDMVRACLVKVPSG